MSGRTRPGRGVRTGTAGTVAGAMVTRLAILRRLLASPRAPLVALAVVSALSLGGRALFLDEPCASPCTTANDHTMIFDEAYYVNAARVIAGIRPPAGDHYSDAPLGTDPNAEHPQGVKLVMAAAIELFGDGPFAWRIGSLLMGSIAILGMFALVRRAGGGRWSALCASTLMACDNLLLVHSRIGTLDIWAVAMMVWALALYLGGRPFVAGIVLAIGTAFKEVAPYLWFVILLIEIARVLLARRDPSAPVDWSFGEAFRRFAVMALTTGAGFVGLLAIMDEIAPPYADAEAKLITGGPFAEIAHIINYAAALTSPHGLTGIASYPWDWLVDLWPIVYLRVSASLPGHETGAIHPVSEFLGMMSPAIMVLAMPAVLFGLYRLVRLSPAGAASASERQMALVGSVWFIGTWTPFALQSLLDSRISYLYYMCIVMPGLYVAITYLVSLAWRRRRRWLSGLTILWALSVLAAVIVMYPFVAAY